MFWQSVDKVGRVIGPVLIHYLAANLISMLGLHADAAFLTSLTAVLVLPLFVWLYKKDRRFSEEESRLTAADAAGIAALGIAANLFFTFLLNVCMQVFPMQNRTQEALFASSLAVQLIGVGILVPVMEEVLFRGLVYQRLTGYTRSAWSAAVLAAAVFAVYHGNLIQMLFAFPMALLLIAVYRKWRTLKAPIVFHMAVNLSSVLLAQVLAELT